MRNLKEYADVTLNDAIKNKELYSYIIGNGKYKIPINNGYGMEHSVYHVVDSLHRYKNVNPNSDIDKQFYTVLYTAFSGPASSDILTLLNTVYTELSYEKQVNDNFSINNAELLSSCKRHLLKNKNDYSNLWKSIEQIDYGMETEHGKRIL